MYHKSHKHIKFTNHENNNIQPEHEKIQSNPLIIPNLQIFRLNENQKNKLNFFLSEDYEPKMLIPLDNININDIALENPYQVS